MTPLINAKPTRKRLSRFDILCRTLMGVIALYFAMNQPLNFTVFGCASLIYLGFWQVSRLIPLVERYVVARVRFWHVVTAIVTSTMVASAGQPAHALFLSGLEEFFIELASESQGAGAAETISEDTISLVFNLIRGVFLLLVAAAALFAYNQAQQGNDWRPIVVQVGLAFAIVIAIDVVTFIFIGDGTGGGGASLPVTPAPAMLTKALLPIWF